MRRVDTYRHLNDTAPVVIKLSDHASIELKGDEMMDALVVAVRSSNYGLHRFMSSFVRKYWTHEDEERKPNDRDEPAAILFRDYLNNGGF